MFLKKNSNKSKAPRPSRLFCCFSTDRSTASHDFENSKKSPAAAAGTADCRVKSKASCFGWFRIRRKKRLPEQQFNNPSSIPAYRARNANANANAAKGKVNRCRSLPAERQKLAADDRLLSMEFQQPLLPQLTPKYDTRSRAETPNFPPEPALSRRKHNQLESNRPAAAASRVNSPARMKRGKKLGPDVGLTVLGVTLAVTIFYGRTAAVVSLCACLYLAAFLRQPMLARKKADRIAGVGHVGSKEYKRKVVKEGLQERGNRNATPIVSALER